MPTMKDTVKTVRWEGASGAVNEWLVFSFHVSNEQQKPGCLGYIGGLYPNIWGL